MTGVAARGSVVRYSDIPGWFNWVDRKMFDTVLACSDASPGVLVELGAYLGRSAVIIGDHRAAGERFVVVDLFGGDASLGRTSADRANRRENNRSYRILTRRLFESNYQALHGELPEIVEGHSTEVVNHVEAGTARFVHVDASHMYAQVATDLQNAKKLLRPDGVVVFDDYRSEHTPGVAAAVWEAVANHGLIPFALTARKFYGTFGSSTEYVAAVRELVAADERFIRREQEILGYQVVRLKVRNAATARPGRTADQRISRGRRIARDYLPPALTRAIVSRRERRR